MMKKDVIPLSNESIQLYKHEQKRLQQKLRKLNEKQQDLAMKWKKRCRQWVARESPDTVFESPESRHFECFHDITVKLGPA